MANKFRNPFNPIFSWYIKKRLHQIELFVKYPIEVQQETLLKLLKFARNTEFGKKYDFNSIKSVYDFKKTSQYRHTRILNLQ